MTRYTLLACINKGSTGHVANGQIHVTSVHYQGKHMTRGKRRQRVDPNAWLRYKYIARDKAMKGENKRAN